MSEEAAVYCHESYCHEQLSVPQILGRIMRDVQNLIEILTDTPHPPAIHLIDPSYDLADIEAELELQALEIGDLEK
jgi:hypothetical protein